MTSCPEKTINLPKNDASTCWWLSSNLVLFHTQRPELDHIFNKTYVEYVALVANPLPENVWKNYKNVYEYYQGKNTTITPQNLIDYRRIEEMKELFNVKKNGEILFDVAGKNFQDAQEYLTSFFNYIDFKAVFILSASAETVYLHLWDILLEKLTFGLEKQVNIRSRIETFQLNKNTHSLLININRSNPDSYKDRALRTKPVKSLSSIFERIVVPLINTDNDLITTSLQIRYQETQPEKMIELLDPQNILLTTFYLDAILCVSDGHYFAYVKCTGSDEWLRYNAMSSGKLKTSFPDFTNMMESQKELPNQATLLVYHRV